MKLYIEIIADSNDSDYVTERTEVTSDIIGELLPVIKAIKECKNHYNWPNFDRSDLSPCELYVKTGLITEEQYDHFSEYMPYIEGGIHSIVEINILKVAGEINLFKK